MYVESLGLCIAYTFEICKRFKENGIFKKFENVRDNLYTCFQNRKIEEFAKKDVQIDRKLLDKIHI